MSLALSSSGSEPEPVLLYLLDRWRLGRLSRLSPTQLGALGERIAARYLSRKGMRMIERNADLPHGEIDLIALDRDRKTIVFVEVKTRRCAPHASARYRPETNITSRKREKLVRLAEQKIRHRGWEDRAKRIDVVAVELSEGDAPVIRHHRAAVGRCR